MTVSTGGRIRRAALSRSFALALAAVVLGGTVWFLSEMNVREQDRAAQQAQAIAHVITAATVQHRLDVGVTTGADPMPVSEAADLARADDELRHTGRLAGVGIWKLDGTQIFADQPSGTTPMHVTPGDLARAWDGSPWTTAGAAVDGRQTIRVFLPTRPGVVSAAADAWLVAVDVPHDAASAVLSEQAQRQQLLLVGAAALLLAALLWLRWSLLRGEHRARTDALTGLPNHSAMVEASARILRGATLESPAAVLLFDLAEFKSVNDTLGHLAGDELLQQVGAFLRGHVRHGDLVARLGGDEFSVLLTDLPDVSSAQLRAEQLLAQLRDAPFLVRDISLVVDASVGIALAPQHGAEFMELLQRADIAMYEAKDGHKGTMLYDAARDSHSVDKLELVAELRRALDHGEFVLHYQPKMALPDRRIYGVEALVRWQHPTRGLLPPAAFLPLLETTGLIQPLSRWVLKEAIQQAAAWRRAGRPLKVAVNMSTRSLFSPALPDTVFSTLAEAGLPPSFLELEITETSVMTNPELAARILTQLRAREVDVSIDDFGAGYTSLAFLRILPVSALKIDRSLVSRTLESASAQGVTETVIELGHRLGLRVIAEGVENEELLDRLASLGCDRAQGYTIARPLPPAELDRWLASWRAAEEERSQPVATRPGR